MERLRVCVLSVFLLVVYASHLTNAVNEKYTLDEESKPLSVDIVRLEHERQRRDTSASAIPNTTVAQKNITEPILTTDVTIAATTEYKKHTKDSNETAPTVATVSVTKVPLLGVNGSGQLHVNPTGSVPKVSEPIEPDDNDVFKMPERIASEQNLSNVTYDNHSFYNSTFIGNLDYFNEYWANISMSKVQVHPILSNSHRRATSIRLSFDFPFYGHNIRNITVATGGFIYTGDHVHNWLAATQYIAPLMANFDTTLTNDSVIKLVDDGDNFTAFWENVTLQEDPSKKFTFAVTLYKTGDIVFAYKNVPIEVQDIIDTEHPVKVGVSDAYLTDKIVFYVRRKTIYEYHRVSFKDHMITNNTILKIVALPTCLQYDTCDSCIHHNTGFNCSWCPPMGKCSSGTDRNKQDWLLRRCEKAAITNVSLCPNYSVHEASTNTTYVMADQKPVVNKTGCEKAAITNVSLCPNYSVHEASTNTTYVMADQEPVINKTEVTRVEKPQKVTLTHESRTNVGGIVGGLLVLTLVCCLAWALYAFKHPHTRSGQFLIKYRPTQWNWRRGEARYTAATIHM